jgi:Rrf2 family iron-sulfur cluster assembly transcriptional regulator
VLKVSQKLEYAMRAMIELAQRRDEGVLVPAREIAERQQIPVRFLEQQLGALSKAGLVESFRGAGGRPFFRVTTCPSNSRLARHFMQ